MQKAWSFLPLQYLSELCVHLAALTLHVVAELLLVLAIFLTAQGSQG